MPTKSNMCLGEGNVGFILCSKNVFGFWLDIKEETAASNDWISCSSKLTRGHKKMKIMFNKHLPYITHFIVLHPFLRRPQTSLTAELDKKNLNQAKKKLSSLLIKVQAIPYF